MGKQFNLADDTVFDLAEPGQYQVVLFYGQEPQDYLELCVGFTCGKMEYFEHPGVWGRETKKFEFKHYAPNGNKWWTSEMGVLYRFRVPRSRIMLLDEKGYSYPAVEIGGAKITLNTSGGSWGKSGWADFINRECHTMVNMPEAELRAIADNAIPKEGGTDG